MKRTEQDWLAWANEHLPPALVKECRAGVERSKVLARAHAWKPEPPVVLMAS